MSYLSGDGIEIGPLSSPLPLPGRARVRYVDRLSVAGLRDQYPELGTTPLVPPDVVDDAEVLSSFDDSSLDFIAASHFIEHCENPIRTIENHLSKLRAGGVLFLVIPDKRETFDVGRPVTTVDHLMRDYVEGSHSSRRTHFEEWVRGVTGLTDTHEVEREVERLDRIGYSIHFHVWTPEAFLDVVRHCQRALGFPLELRHFEQARSEFFVVITKTGT